MHWTVKFGPDIANIARAAQYFVISRADLRDRLTVAPLYANAAATFGGFDLGAEFSCLLHT